MNQAEEKGITDSFREWISDRSVCRNATDKPMTVCVQDKEASKKDPSTNPTGEWRGEPKVIQPGETLRVNSSTHDIDGIVNKDGTVSQEHGVLWTEQHELEASRELLSRWKGCENATGQTPKVSECSFLIGDPVFSREESKTFTFAYVNSSNDAWHEGRSLKPNTQYRVIPRSSDRWTLDSGVHFHDFHGGYQTNSMMDGAEIGIPKDKIPLGGLIILVWHHKSDGSAVPQIIDFPIGSNAAEISIGDNGGSIHFMIADKLGTYSDNFGDCLIAIAIV